MSQPRRTFADLVALMHRLRSPGGCPWDAEQTHASLRPYVLEEACEVIDAIDSEDDAELRDELGDLLLQVVFHAELAAERGAFRIEDVVEGLQAKLVRRHPHVFSDAEVEDSAEVVRNWASIKQKERLERGTTRASALDGVPRSLPALARAQRVGKKAASVGFDWDCPGGPRRKIDEELAEADAALESGDSEAFQEELGDLLFAIASWGRWTGADAEAALDRALAKFSTRFRAMEEALLHEGREPSQCSPEELEQHWQRVKATERSVD